MASTTTQWTEWELHESQIKQVCCSLVPNVQEFWDFAKAYLTLKKPLNKTETVISTSTFAKRHELPLKYHERYRIPFSLLGTTSFGNNLPDELRRETRHLLHVFTDYKHKKAFQKVLKIIKDKEDLPIREYRDVIVQAVRENQIVLIAGDTGCGKSTQVPQYLMESGFRKMACTQPRRIACQSLAKRVAYETLQEYGSRIAYQIRFEGTKTQATRILFLTEGVLLRQCANDPLLMQYDVIILDEVHERHITCDFLLGILKSIIRDRPQLKLVLMSATIHYELFSRYFDNCSVIKIPGRMYPVEVVYSPSGDEDPRLVDEKAIEERRATGKTVSIMARSIRISAAPYLKIMEQIDQTYSKEERGDLLIFVSGIQEISTLAEELHLYASYTRRWIVLLLHSSLSTAEQDKIFDIAPEGVRKCILSTNIAETSITIDGIRFIIDSGKVKEMGYDSSAKMMRLQEYWISRASAEQRKGRAGRTGPGICYRFYSQREYHHLNDYAVPEILRVPIESILLQIKALGLGDPRTFDFVEQPSLEHLGVAMVNLKNHELLTQRDEAITRMGACLALMPVDLVVGKMLVLSTIFGLIDQLLTIAASLSVPSPFVRFHESQRAILEKRASLYSDHGDAFTLLNVFREWIAVRSEKTISSRKWCQQHMLEEQRLYEISKLKDQFESMLFENQLLNANQLELLESRQQIRKRMYHEQRHWLKKLGRSDNKHKRKLLKLNYDVPPTGDIVSMESEENEDSPQDDDSVWKPELIQNLYSVSSDTNLNSQQINLLKIVMCSGLYPNIAFPDEGNIHRKIHEQIYHTASKNFVLVHPSSVYATSHETIIKPSSEISEDKIFRSDWQFLCYVQLLEIGKPYLINAIRISAVHTCLLFSKHIDTDRECLRLVIDNWLLITFPTAIISEKVLIEANQLRILWKRLINQRLRLSDIEDQFDLDKNVVEQLQNYEGLPSMIRTICQDTLSQPTETMCTENNVSQKFINFLEMEIPSKMERVSPADWETLVPQDPNVDINPLKQGIEIGSFLRYQSLMSVSKEDPVYGRTEHLRTQWTCPRCQHSLLLNRSGVTEHLLNCGVNPMTEAPDRVSSVSKTIPTTTHYCNLCDQTLSMSALEFLRHKRSHGS